jgi:catechol 2,3-dioxygenase-like lactoylglutathione lyase family enzyme
MQTSGLDHIIMTVSDIPRSRAFYGSLLGFELRDVADGFCFPVGDVTIFFFTPRQPHMGDRFDEFRIGLDHLSFAAPNQEELYAFAERLKAAGVETQGVETYFTGHLYVAFRDPDNIQLEYWLPK